MEGSPNYLMDVVEAKKFGYPVLSIATEDVLSDTVLNKVKYLVAISKMRGSKVLIITARNLISYMSWAFPNATELSRAVAEFQRRFGLTINFIELKDFIDKYYSKVTDAEAEVWVNAWVRGASQVVDPSRIDLIKAAKLYLALLRVARERR
jgi:L-fucose isomerase-like protein